MNQYKQAPTLVKIRTILVIILSALVTSVIIELILVERTNALLRETVQGTTSLVQQVIAPVVPAAPAPVQNILPPATSQSSDPQASPLSSSSPAAPDTSVANSPVVTAPVSNVAPIENANLQKLYFSKAKMSGSMATARFADVRDNAASSAAFAWIQATEQGWKVAGVLWYWWVIVTSVITAASIVWRKRVKQFMANKLLYTQHILYAE